MVRARGGPGTSRRPEQPGDALCRGPRRSQGYEPGGPALAVGGKIRRRRSPVQPRAFLLSRRGACRENYPDAAGWFQKAAEGGSVDGQYAIAEMYRIGRGVPKNISQARIWFTKAAKAGNAAAADRLASLPPDSGGAGAVTSGLLPRRRPPSTPPATAAGTGESVNSAAPLTAVTKTPSDATGTDTCRQLGGGTLADASVRVEDTLAKKIPGVTTSAAGHRAPELRRPSRPRDSRATTRRSSADAPRTS